MVHPGHRGSHECGNRPEPDRSVDDDAPATQDDRAAATAAHRPIVHPLPTEPGRVLGQPYQRPDGAAAMVPVLLPVAEPKPLPGDPVRRPRRPGAIPVNACRATLTDLVTRARTGD